MSVPPQAAGGKARGKRIAVVGAGMAGLAAAYEIAQYPENRLTLFEASDRLGGTIETVHAGGFTIECGPDSWVSDKSAARDLAAALGLDAEIIHSNDAVRRNYLVQGRALTPMPDGMRMMVPTRWLPVMESPLFSWTARLAYLREPKRAAELKAEALARPGDFDESVRSFVNRHFGEEATDTIAGPLLAGVFGGDIETLSAGAVLAPFVRLEREHGSLITPTMARLEQAKAEGKPPEAVFTTLRGGLSTLVDAVAASLPDGAVRRQTTIDALHRTETGWTLVSTAGGERKEEAFEGVVLATPAHATRPLLSSLDPEAAELLAMDATSAIVVALCYSAEAAVKLRLPRGFGFLVPPGRALHEEPELLAGTFMHQKFHHRAPEGAVFLRGFFGGLAAPHMMGWDDEQIAAAAHRQFVRLLGPLPAAQQVVVRRWPDSLPQYRVGHPARMKQLAARLQALPGLALTGNAYHGVGLPALVHHGRNAARAVLGLAGDEA